MCQIKMSIDFNRNRTQVLYENILGLEPENLKQNKEMFKNHILTIEESDLLSETIKEDAVDLFFNAALSFSEGIDSIYQRRFSWATVKLYYSVFYCLRASMACKKTAIITNQSTYRLKINAGEKPFNTGNPKYKSTHKGTINHYLDVFSGSDNLLTNLIDNKNVYQWYEDVREIINYREICFEEPDYLSIWSVYNDALSNNELTNLLTLLQNDNNYLYCFQEDYAVVAIPIKRMQETVDDMNDSSLLQLFKSEKFDYLESVIKGQERQIKIWSS